ncbi:MAG: anaerobic carbon-monoxide dehydrogenase catalytic subunit [Oscillospiraceae bacterium]|jgi:carbon-monoxide dehydrogenase catalytic subunit|nr:anaerobic carbon-monoxide dehydrogenase catalytic subunit [Oscillospiraceae bacterium]
MEHTDVFMSRVSDNASAVMLEKAQTDCVETCFDRAGTQKNQCGFGKSGVCCRVCHMGPCRITPKAPKGVCGATADTIAARNFLREVAGGTSAHSDHGRHLVLKLKAIAEGRGAGYAIKDEKALRYNAGLYGIETEGRAANEIALDLADLLLGEFTSQEEDLKTLHLAPQKRQNVWEAKGIKPQGIDRMVVEALHRTSIGVDHDYKNLLMHAFRTSLANGWGGSRAASMVSDILFGTPKPLKSAANLGVLREDTVNILIHGHEPAISEILAAAVSAPDIKEYAKEANAEGITLAGICCTANEVLMRHGVPVAGNMLQQELAIVTGAVEMMVIDVQCCMPGVIDVSQRYHTEIISTADMAKTVGAAHMAVGGADPLSAAKDIIRRAVDNYKNRDQSKVHIPNEKETLVAGFSVDAIKYMLGGRYRASFRPLNDAIIQNRILGVAGIVGCTSTKQTSDYYINTLTEELIKRNVLVLQTGCAAISSAKRGRLTPETALRIAGDGLREVCETVGIPPILHMGSCVDNTRILEAATEIIAEGGLGDDLGGLPAVGVAPEWMSEKAVSIGCYFVASGVDVILGNPFYTSGSDNVHHYLHHEAANDFGACFHYIEDPLEAAGRIVEILNTARKKLGIDKKAERKLLDMKDRRDG